MWACLARSYRPGRAALVSEPRPGVLYRMYDQDGGLVYVGISVSLPARLIQHRQSQPWWSDITSISVQHFPTIREARDAERVAIAEERPRYNVRDSPCPPSGGSPAALHKGQRQHTIGVDDDLWADVKYIAATRHEPMAAVLRRILVGYRDENRELLDAIKARKAAENGETPAEQS